MRPNVKQFVQLMTECVALPSPVVDIGSLRTEGQEGYADLRPFFSGARYTGIDMRSGPGVDGVGTIHRLPFATGSVGTIILLDTLEHVLDPLAAMQEVTRVLGPGGIVLISSHMNFPIHAHPSDYWRFTPMMFDHLLRHMPRRHVLVQGNTENPHTVLGVGCKDASGPGASTFVSAVRCLRERWPDESFGGCLFGADPLLLDIQQREPSRNLPLLTLGRTITQSFLCRQDGLARIDVLMARPAGESLRHLLFRVRDVERGIDVGALRVLALQVVDGEWLSVEFAPQARSSGRTYEVIVTSPDGDLARGVTAKASDVANHAGGRLTIDGETVRGSMCIKTFFRPPSGAVLDPWSEGESVRIKSQQSEHMRDGFNPTEEEWHRARYEAAVHGASEDAERAAVLARESSASHEVAGQRKESGFWRRLLGHGRAASGVDDTKNAHE